MLNSKFRIALALVLASASAAPAFAMKLGGPEHLTMMQKIRADAVAGQRDYVATTDLVATCNSAKGRSCQDQAR
jgi:hypothetical protein